MCATCGCMDKKAKKGAAKKTAPKKADAKKMPAFLKKGAKKK